MKIQKTDNFVPVTCPFCKERLSLIGTMSHPALVCLNSNCFACWPGDHVRWDPWNGMPTMDSQRSSRTDEGLDKAYEANNKGLYLSDTELRDWNREGLATQLVCPLCEEALKIGPEQKQYETLTEHVFCCNDEDYEPPFRDVLVCANRNCKLSQSVLEFFWGVDEGGYYCDISNFHKWKELQEEIKPIKADYESLYGETYGGVLSLDLGILGAVTWGKRTKEIEELEALGDSFSEGENYESA